MRTTMTLDDDVAAQLDLLARRRQMPMRALVNEALRAGLAVLERPQRRKPFRTVGFDLGPSRVGSIDNVEDVLARVEGEDHR